MLRMCNISSELIFYPYELRIEFMEVEVGNDIA